MTFSGCKSAPEIEECWLNGTLEELQCIDERLDDDDRSYIIDLADADNYWCTNETDHQTIVKDCASRRAGFRIESCVVNSEFNSLECSDKRVTPAPYSITYFQASGFWCTNSVDLRILLEYCYRSRHNLE